jgi:hypothetical protein
VEEVMKPIFSIQGILHRDALSVLAGCFCLRAMQRRDWGKA